MPQVREFELLFQKILSSVDDIVGWMSVRELAPCPVSRSPQTNAAAAVDTVNGAEGGAASDRVGRLSASCHPRDGLTPVRWIPGIG